MFWLIVWAARWLLRRMPYATMHNYQERGCDFSVAHALCGLYTIATAPIAAVVLASERASDSVVVIDALRSIVMCTTPPRGDRRLAIAHLREPTRLTRTNIWRVHVSFQRSRLFRCLASPMKHIPMRRYDVYSRTVDIAATDVGKCCVVFGLCFAMCWC